MTASWSGRTRFVATRISTPPSSTTSNGLPGNTSLTAVHKS